MQALELFDRERLCARGRVDPQCADLSGIERPFEIVAQGLPPVGERGGDEFGESRHLVTPDQRCGQWHQPDDTGIHLGWWMEGFRTDVEQRVDLATHLQHHRQAAVGLGAGTGGHAGDHLPLQHEVHVLDGVCLLDQVEQQRGRDVVRQITDHAQSAIIRAQAAEVEFQCVRVVQPQLAQAGTAALQRFDQITVELDRVEFTDAPQQTSGQRALARADLDQSLPLARIDAVQDALDHGLVVQKVLAEPFPGTVAQGLVLMIAKEFSGL